MKKLRVFLFLFAILPILCSCVGYISQSKQNVELSPWRESARTESGQFIETFLNEDYYTKENIVKLFGTPLRTEKEDGVDVLTYEMKKKPLRTQSSLFFHFHGIAVPAFMNTLSN